MQDRRSSTTLFRIFPNSGGGYNSEDAKAGGVSDNGDTIRSGFSPFLGLSV